MTRAINVMMFLGLAVVLAVQANPLPEDVGREEGKKTNVLHAYTETNDTYSTIDEILAEISASKGGLKEGKTEHIVTKRALGCSNTGVAYGSTTGTAFADFTSTDPWPCGVDMHEIRIRHGSLIDAVQVQYKTVDGQYLLKPSRGGPGGRESLIRLEEGERITGVAGTECAVANLDNKKYIVQLVFYSEKNDGQKVVYGPYGTGHGTFHPCKMFAVHGKINSIFGKAQVPVNSGRIYLGALGFYYEDESRARQHTAA